MGISTHILDTTRGRPAAGVAVLLERGTGTGFERVGGGTTDSDGRVKPLLPSETALDPGIYRITFAVGDYFHGLGIDAFYPEVQIQFCVGSSTEHYHVPLLLNPYGYSTYRGS